MEAQNAQLTLEMARLRIENNQLKKKIKLQEPLVKVGVLVRRGFLQEISNIIVRQGFSREVAKVPNTSMVLAGYYAAHQGNVRADECMFELGYLKNQELIPSPGEPETEFEATFRSLFEIMYELPLGGAQQGLEALPFSRNVLEAAEMRVTMNSLCELFPQGKEEKADYDRFRALVIQFHQGAENTTTSTSDVEAKVELIVREMREITEKASQTCRRRNATLVAEGMDFAGLE